MKKLIIVFISIPFVLFIIAIVFSRIRNVGEDLKREKGIDIYITKIIRKKAFLLLNDSISISEMTPRLKINSDKTKINGILYYKELKDFKKPYRLIKYKNNDTILIVTKYDTLYYKLISNE